MLIVRFVIYVALGALLLPLAAIVGSLSIRGAPEVWGLALLFTVLSGELKAVFAMIITPVIFAAQYAWPVTCVLFPIVGVMLKPRAFNIAVFSVLGALAGPASVYATAKLGLSPFLSARGLQDFILTGVVSGAILGLVFGFAVWRINATSGDTGRQTATSSLA